VSTNKKSLIDISHFLGNEEKLLCTKKRWLKKNHPNQTLIEHLHRKYDDKAGHETDIIINLMKFDTDRYGRYVSFSVVLNI